MSECSQTCGGGRQSFSRECNDPPPENGGDRCEGDSQEERICNDHPCDVKQTYKWFIEWTRTCTAGTEYGIGKCVNDRNQEVRHGYCTDVRPRETRPCNKQQHVFKFVIEISIIYKL